MKNYIKIILSIIFLIFTTNKIFTQSCSGTWTSVSNVCQNTTIGNGTAGYIKVCLTTNNIPSGGGTSCSPGASCGVGGGGWSPRINIQTSGGTTSTTWIGSTAVGTCFYVPVQDGYAIIQGFCLTAGTVITYETVDACNNNLCSGATPCVPVNCNNCSTSCGTASGFSSNPTVAQVVSACETNPFIPAIQPSTTNTSCYDFRATNTTVNFNVIITSNCSGGNVSAFSWSLYNATCGGTIQTGTLASLTFSGLTVGNDYVFCYTFTVPATCTHSQHCPYFVGATVLPVTLSKFDAKYDAGKVNLDWTTETEINNDYFTIERSSDMENFEVLGIVKGNGNSNTKINYNFYDKSPIKGTSYYRLKQTDYDGTYKYSKPVSVIIKSKLEDVNIYPNPITGNGFIAFNSLEATEQLISIYDIAGRVVYEKTYAIKQGENKLVLETTNLTKGMYFIHLADGAEGVNIKFIKE